MLIVTEAGAEVLHERMAKVMLHVASNTRDRWAREYLIQRLLDLGCDAEITNPVTLYDEK